MGILVVATLLLALLLPAPASAAVSADVLAAPQPVLGTDGRRHLAYEILLINPDPAPVTLHRVTARDTSTGRRLLALGLGQLPGVTINPLGATTTIGAGGIALLVLDVRLPAGAPAPATISHRLRLLRRARGRLLPVVVDVPSTAVDRRAPVVLQRPLRGGGLVDGGGCCRPSGHRGAILLFGDRLVVAQRYAIDFLRIDEDGLTSSGDPGRNASYFIYGDEVLAAAAGTVVATRDGMPDGTPPDGPVPVPPTDDLAGNRVVVDIGAGRFLMYGHLRPGSVRVHPGDHVDAGDLLGAVGNSGNSTEPHLHFQVMDAAGGPSALDASGLPFVIDAFRYEGLTGDFLTLERFPRPLARTREMPLWGDVVDFG